MRLIERKAVNAVVWNRREFLRSAIGVGASRAFFGLTRMRAARLPRKQKALVVTFGGGARDAQAQPHGFGRKPKDLH